MSDEQNLSTSKPLLTKGLLLLALLFIIAGFIWVLFTIMTDEKIVDVPFNCESCLPLPNNCGPNNEQGILLTGHIVATNILSVVYETPLANNPKLYKNWIGVWEGAYMDYSVPPLQRVFIDQTDRCGSYAFDSLELKTGQDYIVGYGVGDSIASVGATVMMPWQEPGFKVGKSTRTLVHPVEIGSDYVVIYYCTPLGNDAKANRNWVGIQQGNTFTYSNNRFKMYPINSTSNSGHIVINNFTIEPDTWYTVVIGLGNEKKDIAASWTFNGNESKGRCPDRCTTRCDECQS